MNIHQLYVDSTGERKACVQEMGERETDLGWVLYIRVFTNNYRQLSWSEVWRAFERNYPGRWAVQVFPPSDQLVDETNIYHLFVLLDGEPIGLNIAKR